MKKAISVVFAAVMAVAFSVSAYAADPDLFKNSTGTEVYGTVIALGVAPAAQSISGKTIVLYAGSAGWQNVEDPTGAEYTKIKNRLVAEGAVEVGTGTGIYYVPNRMIRTGCFQNGSYLLAENTANIRTDYLANDGCAYRDKVRAVAN